MIAILIFLVFLVAIDVYAFFGIKVFALASTGKIFYICYFSTSAITVAGVLLLFYAMSGGYSTIPLYINLLFGMAFSFIMAKLFMASFFLIEDIFRGFIWLFQSALRFRMAESIPRSFIAGMRFLTVGFIIIILLNLGVSIGRYNFKVRNQTLEFANLPDSFDGFKIGQISDMHLGTFDQMRRVQKGFDLLQKQNPDIILFTGDMVNNRATEAIPFIEMIKSLKAPLGKFSILGNHDYGEYLHWKTKDEHDKNLDQLKSIESQMGFTGLYNSNAPIVKGNDTIYLAGVENWGAPPFPQYGDLSKALDSLTSEDFIVLMSHDPSHWRMQVLKSTPKVELTLSGHTHGMQFGIEIGNLRWSPVKYRYPDWADLFTENGQYLYVNRGFGSIGFPGRVGIRPEITIIELKKKILK